VGRSGECWAVSHVFHAGSSESRRKRSTRSSISELLDGAESLSSVVGGAGASATFTKIGLSGQLVTDLGGGVGGCVSAGLPIKASPKLVRDGRGG
jgi:hypothetical protein